VWGNTVLSTRSTTPNESSSFRRWAIAGKCIAVSEPRGPFGAKEVGEGATLPVLGAVAHAIANATGVWITDLPITPEKILRAIREKSAVAEEVGR